MLQSENIQSFLQLTSKIMSAWIIIPDRQEESCFPNHKQFVHLSRVCDMLVRNSLRNKPTSWCCNNKTLFYLHENLDTMYGEFESVRMTEWAREALLNHSCTQSCTNCTELIKGKRTRKIECRMTD